MHVDAMHDDVGMFEAGAKRGAAGGNAHQFLAAQRIQHQHRRRRIGDSHHLLGQAEAIEHMKDVGAELDAVADGAEFGCAFEHAGRPAAER